MGVSAPDRRTASAPALTYARVVINSPQLREPRVEKAPASPGYRFGAFEIDPRAGELRKHGIRIKLQDQPMQVLSMLLERPGEVVTREELRTALWPADTFVDFDHGLNSAINKLREALSDSADT